MRRTRRQNFLMSNLIYVITGILIIIVLVLVLGAVFGKDDKKGAGDSTMLDAENGLDIGEVKDSLKEDTVPELTELIQQYYNAMSTSDITTLEQIVSDVTDADKDIIRRKKDYIESYNNITVYSKLAPVDGCFLVFAGYDIKFVNEETMVPGLETFYVKTSKDDSLYIYKGSDIEPEVETFINEQIASKEVQALFEDVNDRYVDALASSATLLSFIEGFGGDTKLIEEAKKKAATMTAEASQTVEPEQTEEQGNESDNSGDSQETTENGDTQPQETAAPTEAPADTTQATATNETVLIIANVNLRSSNDETSERLTTMIVGDQATRVSITDNGWSKVQYNGTEGYVKTDYVTTFKLASDSVKPTTTINVRYEASETANMAGQITPDMTITRYAICDNGWSQISYDGGVGYVKTEYLTN